MKSQKTKNFSRVKIRIPAVKKEQEVKKERNLTEIILDEIMLKMKFGPIILNVSHVKGLCRNRPAEACSTVEKTG